MNLDHRKAMSCKVAPYFSKRVLCVFRMQRGDRTSGHLKKVSDRLIARSMIRPCRQAPADLFLLVAPP